MCSRFIPSISICLLWMFSFSNARIFTMEMHHRFSDQVKEWSHRSGARFSVQNWPEKGSAEYYALLVSHDFAIRGRALSSFDGGLTFSDGNATFRISSLGFLHYTTVTVGTPGTKFLVALDTGSNLFWVPCNCKQCSSTDDSPYSSDFQLSIYDPDESSTSKNVTCYDDQCTYRGSCNGTSSNCPYYVSYVSLETSTSGILLEDILHLKAKGNDQELIKEYVTFGCGQVQTGSFLDIAAPNGLFGLGLDKISVPSTLSREGYISNSFSMCFGQDGTGRINFGDNGTLDQEETPFRMNSFHPAYNVNVTQVQVGTTVLDSELTALFDSGTSFTYLVDPLYTMFSDSFHYHVRDARRHPDPRMPFEYCYIMRSGPQYAFKVSSEHVLSWFPFLIDENSSNTTTSWIPGISLTMDGGGQLVVYDPAVVISTQREFIYCLAVVKSQELNILGQNFMSGYRIVFDRERLILGWKKFDCYELDDSNAIGPKSVNYTSVPPAGAVDLPQSDEPDSKTFRNLVAPSLHKYIKFDLIHSFFVSLLLAFQSP